jgi:hypothetical protein
MNLNAWLTLIGIVASPIVAVIITLWVERRRRNFDGKMLIARTLMMTRHFPGDANYSNAINLMRIEFADCPEVIQAYQEYGRQIRREEATTSEGITKLHDEMKAAQTKMLSAVLRRVGMNVSEADLALEAYAAGGFIHRDNLYLNSLDAQIRTANALERSFPPSQ